MLACRSMAETNLRDNVLCMQGEVVETAAMKRSKGARRRRLSYVVDEKDVRPYRTPLIASLLYALRSSLNRVPIRCGYNVDKLSVHMQPKLKANLAVAQAKAEAIAIKEDARTTSTDLKTLPETQKTAPLQAAEIAATVLTSSSPRFCPKVYVFGYSCFT